ncbi:hypothetical protein BD311DRAFT_771419 [Dichomitus squalens]|uniref:Uncharacterized protein n=1 Tax=Dichomitus squalens TaxID=114155 RepID=A0A4Q9M4V4_9APHY|nr:hypothetical protein BD311DRAFT_771419 [Dichomitus squalens]
MTAISAFSPSRSPSVKACFLCPALLPAVMPHGGTPSASYILSTVCRVHRKWSNRNGRLHNYMQYPGHDHTDE